MRSAPFGDPGVQSKKLKQGIVKIAEIKTGTMKWWLGIYIFANRPDDCGDVPHVPSGSNKLKLAQKHKDFAGVESERTIGVNP
jgi:hypothetical protein